MKKSLAFFMGILMFGCLAAQSPQSIPYQAVVRNASGNLVVNQLVSFRFTIHDGSTGGTVVYQETQSGSLVKTNNLGLVTVQVGGGTPVGSYTFSAINWGNNTKFMDVELDPAGGTSYTDMGTSQMMSVPYALYAANAGTATSGGTAQVNADWNASSGLAQILNKPTIPVFPPTGGTSAQYINGAGSLVTFPTIPTATNYIVNSSSAQSGANFNISGSGTIAGSLNLGSSTLTGSVPSYGTFTASGTAGGYAGIDFSGASTSGTTLMVGVSNGVQGFYDNTSGWDWYFQSGVLTAGTVPWVRITPPVGGTTAEYINGTGALATFPSYQAPITLGFTGTADAAGNVPATFSSNTLNVPSHGRKLYTASGTFTVPTGVTQLWVSGAGGGGGGGGTIANNGGAGGGGAGAACMAISVSGPGLAGASITVTIGAGGAGMTSTQSNIEAGTTSFGSYITLTGGYSPVSYGQQETGGAPGKATGTSVTGASAVTVATLPTTATIFGGAQGGAGGPPGGGGGTGGGGIFGAGGGGGLNTGSVAVPAGYPGQGYGAGGGGGMGTSGSGGAGSGGFILVEW